jgi:hypothetical protein
VVPDSRHSSVMTKAVAAAEHGRLPVSRGRRVSAWLAGKCSGRARRACGAGAEL